MHSSRTFPDKLKIQNMKKKKIVAALNLKKELISDPITKLFGVSEYEVSLHKIYKFPSAYCLLIIYNMK